MTQIVIYGSREFGKVLRPLVNDVGGEFLGFIDDWDSGDEILGPLDVMLPKLQPGQHEFVIAIGYKHLGPRWHLVERLRDLGFGLPSLIHPRAHVHGSARVDAGAIVMAGAIVDLNTTIGSLAVLWPGAIVNHDSQVGPNTFLSPNATICGHAVIGRDCMIGAGAVIVDHTSVPDGSFVKAGTVFHAGTRSVPTRS